MVAFDTQKKKSVVLPDYNNYFVTSLNEHARIAWYFLWQVPYGRNNDFEIALKYGVTGFARAKYKWNEN